MLGWVYAGELEVASDLTTGSLIDRPGSLAQQATDRRMRDLAGPVVQDAIARNYTPGESAAAYMKASPLTAEMNMSSLPDGVYMVTNGTVAQAQGLPSARPGVLTSNYVGTSGATTQIFQSIEANAAGSRMFVRDKLGGVFSPWKELQVGRVYRGVQPQNTDLNNLIEDGVYATALGTTLNRPVEVNGFVEVITVGIGVMQRYTTVGIIPEVWIRRGNISNGAGVWANPWVRIDAGAAINSGGGGDSSGPVRRELLRQQLTARKGKIGTGGKGAIALRFDDAPTEFVEKVLPLLVERGLPFTRVTTSERISATPLPEGVFDQMQTYSLAHGGEVFNHGKTHGEAGTQADIEAEITGALSTLRAAMPRLPIDCFSPPGGSIAWGGYMPSTSIASWADTHAGRLLIAHHALATGYLPNSYYWPLDGQARDGQVHYSCDAYDAAATKTLINRARDWGVGVVLMWHANNLDQSGQMSLTQLVEVLDYLVEQREAGNIFALTVSGMACADKSITARDDLLTTRSGASWSETITFPQYRREVPGSTRELVATVTGAAGASVTSRVGASEKVHRIPSSGTLRLRHCATIPTDVTALQVSITGATTAGARLCTV